MEKSNFKILLMFFTAIIIVPIINSIYGFIPAAATGFAALIAIIVIILFFATRTKSKPVSKGICSDIRSIDIKVNGRNYIINSGESFNTDDHEHPGVMSYIENGIWYIADDPSKTLSGMTAEITVPENLTLDFLKISAHTGNVLINSISARFGSISAFDSYVQVNGLNTEQLSASVGKGTLVAEVALSGNAQLSCGSGEMTLKLNNRKDLYTVDARVGKGTITIDNEQVPNSSDRTEAVNENAQYKINAQCGLGTLRMEFAEVTANDEN